MATSKPKREPDPDIDEPIKREERLILGVDRSPAGRVHYRVVSAPIHGIEVALAKWLADGWAPCGGPSIDSRDGTMHQAITKTI